MNNKNNKLNVKYYIYIFKLGVIKFQFMQVLISNILLLVRQKGLAHTSIKHNPISNHKHMNLYFIFFFFYVRLKDFYCFNTMFISGYVKS